MDLFNYTVSPYQTDDTNEKDFANLINIVCRPILVIFGTVGKYQWRLLRNDVTWCQEITSSDPVKTDQKVMKMSYKMIYKIVASTIGEFYLCKANFFIWIKNILDDFPKIFPFDGFAFAF